jgi:hypothetical protein
MKRRWVQGKQNVFGDDIGAASIQTYQFRKAVTTTTHAIRQAHGVAGQRCIPRSGCLCTSRRLMLLLICYASSGGPHGSRSCSCQAAHCQESADANYSSRVHSKAQDPTLFSIPLPQASSQCKGEQEDTSWVVWCQGSPSTCPSQQQRW